MSLRAVAQSRVVLVVGVTITLAVPLLTMPHLSAVSPWPIVLGLLP